MLADEKAKYLNVDLNRIVLLLSLMPSTLCLTTLFL